MEAEVSIWGAILDMVSSIWVYLTWQRRSEPLLRNVLLLQLPDTRFDLELMMMRSRQPGFLFILTLLLVVLIWQPLQAQEQATSDPTPLSALRLDPQQFATFLDTGQYDDAILQLEEGWRLQLNEYYGRFFRTAILPPSQIAQVLRQTEATVGETTALVYAVSTPNHLDVILLLPDGQLLHHRQSDATREAVQATTQDLRRGVVSVTSSPRDYLPPGQQLYDWMLAPLESALEEQDVSTLIFCLGGGLRSVPLAALHDGDQFLIERYGLGIIPAFNLLDYRPAQLAEAQVLAMGASEFETQQPLPAVPLELEAIAQFWPSTLQQNQAFTLDSLRDLRSQHPFPIIHLATHANFAPGDVEDSYIQFWDHRIWLDQVQVMDLDNPPVELLVLSACQTAMGDPNAELGFAGLAVQSGAKAAIASLWSISDAGTFVFMTGFYQALTTAPTKGEALRQTQIAMLRGDLTFNSAPVQQVVRAEQIPAALQPETRVDLSHPYYWAGFTMIGNPW